jgi:transposase
MSKGKAVVLSREFKLAALDRMLAGENVSALARELGISRAVLYKWRRGLLHDGPDGLRRVGRPYKAVAGASAEPLASVVDAATGGSELLAARRRIVELERKVGQQQLELDFFKVALRQLRTSPPPGSTAGAPASTLSSKR